MISLNLQGLLYVAHAAIPHLLRAAEREPRRVADLVNVSSVAGRRVGAGGGIYQADQARVGVFSEALRQEITARHVRSSLIEPGATESELVTHVREEVRDQLPPGVERDPQAPRTSPTRSSTSSRARDMSRSTRSSSAPPSRSASRRRKMRRTPHDGRPAARSVACNSSEGAERCRRSRRTAPSTSTITAVVEDRHEDIDGYTVNFVSFRQDVDGAPLLTGLPDDRCPCPHWGYVLKGRLTYRFADHDEVFEAGDAFYLAARPRARRRGGERARPVQPERAAARGRRGHAQERAGDAGG